MHPRNRLTSHLRSSPLPFPASPSSSRSDTSTPEHRPLSLKQSPTPEPSCREANPVFNNIRKKWCCGGCDKDFRGKWECGRHIRDAGKRSKCLGLHSFQVREDGAVLCDRGDCLAVLQAQRLSRATCILSLLIRGSLGDSAVINAVAVLVW